LQHKQAGNIMSTREQAVAVGREQVKQDKQVTMMHCS
jgi:hypothetical protein